MTKTHKLTIRIEEDLRERAHKATQDMGMSLSEYVHRQLTLLVDRKELNEKLLKIDQELNESPPKSGRLTGVRWLER